MLWSDPVDRTPVWKEPADRPGGKRNTVIVQTVGEAIVKRRKEVRDYERRYGCGSRAMLEALWDGKATETLETNKWMSAFFDLSCLTERAGCPIGIPFSTTRRLIPESELPAALWTEPDRPGWKRDALLAGDVDDELDVFRKRVLSFEHRYQVNPLEIYEEQCDGTLPDTLDATEWMNSFHDLVWLAGQSGRTIGIPMRTTRPSTTAT